jgi:hypothetical protein
MSPEALQTCTTVDSHSLGWQVITLSYPKLDVEVTNVASASSTRLSHISCQYGYILLGQERRSLLKHPLQVTHSRMMQADDVGIGCSSHGTVFLLIICSTLLSPGMFCRTTAPFYYSSGQHCTQQHRYHPAAGRPRSLLGPGDISTEHSNVAGNRRFHAG